MRRLTLGLAPVLLVVGLVAPSASAQVDPGRCAELFPDTVFDHATSAGPIQIYGHEVPAGVLDRYGRDFAVLADWIVAEMGGLDEEVTICMFQDQLPLDAEALGWPRGQQLRALALGAEKMVVLSNWFPRHVPGAGYNGILHVAQYQVSGGAYPEPFGNEVRGWYRNRLDRSVEAVHNSAVRSSAGLAEPFPTNPGFWVSGQMRDPILWNPEFGWGGAGDFANFAFSVGGRELFADPVSGDLDTIDAAWKQALFDESGAIPGGSKGWLTGLGFSLAIIAIGIFMPWWNRRQKRRFEAQLRDLPWLEEQSRLAREREAIRTSVATGPSGADPRVGGSGSGRAVQGDHRDRPPTGRAGGAGGDGVAGSDQTGDDRFRHPGFDEER